MFWGDWVIGKTHQNTRWKSGGPEFPKFVRNSGSKKPASLSHIYWEIFLLDNNNNLTI